MTTDVHNLGNFASLAAAWERYPNGAMVGDYIFIAGVRYDWDKYEKQWLTPVAVTDMNISVFDVSTYDFEANDWRRALPNGEYTVVSNTQAVGKLLKYDDGFVLEGFVTLTEAGADKVFSPVVDGDKPKADAKILSGNQSCHKYVYVDSKGVYNVSSATERGQIDDIQHHLDDLQQYVDDNLNSLDKAVSAIKKDIGAAEDAAAADGTLYARIKKNADDIAENKGNVKVLIERVNTVTGTANEAKALTKVNEERLNSVQATANTALENSERNQDSVRNAQVTANEAKASVEGLTIVTKRMEVDVSQLQELNVVYSNKIRNLTTESTLNEIQKAFEPVEPDNGAIAIVFPHVGYLIKGNKNSDDQDNPDSTIISVEIVKIDNKDCHKFMYIDNNRDLVTMTVYLAGITDCKVIERSVVSNIDTIINNINTFDDFYTRMTDFVIGDNDDRELIKIETLQQNSINLKYKSLDTVNGDKAEKTKTIPAVSPGNGTAGVAGMNLVHDIPYFFDFYKPGFTSLPNGSDITKVLIPKFQTSYDLFDDLYTDVPAIQNKVFAYPKAGDRIRMGMSSLLGTPGVRQMWATVTSAQFISDVYSVTVDYDGDTYIFAYTSSNDIATLKVPWSKVSPKRNVYTNGLKRLDPECDEARIKDYLTPQVYSKYGIVYPVKPQTGDLIEERRIGSEIYVAIKVVRNEENPNEYTDILIPESGTANAYTRIVLKNDLTAVKSRNPYYILETSKRAYNGNLLLALDTVKAETIKYSILYAYTFTIDGRDTGLAAQRPQVGDLIKMQGDDGGDSAPVCEIFFTGGNVQHTRWFCKGKLYEVTVNTALTRVPEDPKVIYDTTSGTLRDLYISAGAKYNEQTGYYELNGLTDITEEEMRAIYTQWQKDVGTATSNTGWLSLPPNMRTNLPSLYRADLISRLSNSIGGVSVEVLCITEQSNYTRVMYLASTEAVAQNNMPKLRRVIGIWRYNDNNPSNFKFSYGQPFGKCPLLEEIRMSKINKSHTFAVSPNLSKESVLYMITNANPPSGAAAGSITITLHPTAYARLKDDADIVAALEAKGGIVTLVSA